MAHSSSRLAESGSASPLEGYRLEAVLEAARELAGVNQPRRALEVGLLSAMGALGAVCGVCLFVDDESGRIDLVSRGFAPEDARLLEQDPPRWLHGLAMDGSESDWTMAEAPLTPSEAPGGLLPSWVVAAQAWRAGPAVTGLLVLGERLDPRPLESQERLVLQEIAAFMAATLRMVLSSSRISDLNARLHEKNRELSEALEESARAGRSLDRKVFHLSTVNDLTRELAGLVDRQAIANSLLLLVQGAFQTAGGAVLLLDRRQGEVLAAVRGVPGHRAPDADRLESALYGCLEQGGLEGLHPLSVKLLPDPEQAAQEAGLDMAPSAGAFMMIGADFMGLFLLGPTLDDRVLEPDETGLLLTHLSNALVFLENARSFEVVQRLNRDLARRNEELTRTIKELKEARDTISVMESVQLLMRSALSSELDRVGKASLWDYAVIIAVSAAIALLFNAISPNGIPLAPEHLLAGPPPSVTAEQAKALAEPVVVDARPATDFERGHLPGAVNMPPGFFDMTYAMRLSKVDLDRPVLVYGRTVSRLYDREAAMKLEQRDHGRVVLLEGGFSAWKERGLPVEAGR